MQGALTFNIAFVGGRRGLFDTYATTQKTLVHGRDLYGLSGFMQPSKLAIEQIISKLFLVTGRSAMARKIIEFLFALFE